MTVEPPTDQDQPAKPARRGRLLWVGAATVVALVAAGGAAYAIRSGGSDEDTAVERCQGAIRDKLFAPSTAKFADEVKQNNKPPVFRISGELDAQNKLGGTLRGEYFCVLQLNDDGSWQTLEARTITR